LPLRSTLFPYTTLFRSIYNRVLADEEAKAVRNYLSGKYARLKEALPAALKLPGAGQLLERVANPPPVQMLVPGFTARQLPVDLRSEEHTSELQSRFELV